MNALTTSGVLSCVAFLSAMSPPSLSVAEGVTDGPLPALLRDATARGGWISACPPRDERERKMIESVGQLAISPEVDKRLKEQFPPGSSAGSLERELDAEGFKRTGTCQSDQSVYIATYHRKASGFLGAGGITAGIYWKTDAAGSIVWATGIVLHTGL